MMMMRTLTRAALAAALLTTAAAGSALAQGDAPGGGATGTYTPQPVTGEAIWGQTCQACHMADARGATGAATIPALAGNPKLAIAAYPITIVLIGKGAMPGFADTLSPAQIAAVITYARTHFGNRYAAPVTAADVTRIAASGAHR
jgi:mono/diheme cytochrome c family protein